MKNDRHDNTSVSSVRWAAYAAAGAACAFSTQQAAEADITVVPVGVSLSAPGGSIVSTVVNLPAGTLQFYHQATSSGSGEGIAKADIDPNGLSAVGALAGFSSAFGTAGGGIVTYNYVSNLPYGAAVSAASFLGPGSIGTMAFRGGYGNDQFLAAGTAYIGFTFDAGAGTQYGWVEVTMGGAPLNDYTIEQLAYAGPGESITAGQTTPVPEPASVGALGLLAFGATGLSRWRKARKVA